MQEYTPPSVYGLYVSARSLQRWCDFCLTQAPFVLHYTQKKTLRFQHQQDLSPLTASSCFHLGDFVVNLSDTARNISQFASGIILNSGMDLENVIIKARQVIFLTDQPTNEEIAISANNLSLC